MTTARIEQYWDKIAGSPEFTAVFDLVQSRAIGNVNPEEYGLPADVEAHQRRTAVKTAAVALRAGLDVEIAMPLSAAALGHDIAKLLHPELYGSIESSADFSAYKLTLQQEHPVVGARMIMEGVQLLLPAKRRIGVYAFGHHCHRKNDKYPQGKEYEDGVRELGFTEEDILSLDTYGFILGFADHDDAITNPWERRYIIPKLLKQFPHYLEDTGAVAFELAKRDLVEPGLGLTHEAISEAIYDARDITAQFAYTDPTKARTIYGKILSR